MPLRRCYWLRKTDLGRSMLNLVPPQRQHCYIRAFTRAYGHLKNMSDPAKLKPVESTIRLKLTNALSPAHIEIINESYMHNVPKGSETHFKVIVVSEKFNGQPLIKRHRAVNDLLQSELQTSVHALSIVAKTPAQWEESSKLVESSPACRGGFGK